MIIMPIFSIIRKIGIFLKNFAYRLLPFEECKAAAVAAGICNYFSFSLVIKR